MLNQQLQLLECAANWLRTKDRDKNNIRYAYCALIEPLRGTDGAQYLLGTSENERTLWSTELRIVQESDNYDRKNILSQGYNATTFRSTLDTLCKEVERLIFSLEDPGAFGQILILAYYSFLEKTANGVATRAEETLARCVGMNIREQKESANQKMRDMENKFTAILARTEPVQEETEETEETVRIHEITLEQLLEENDKILLEMLAEPAEVDNLKRRQKTLIDQINTSLYMLEFIGCGNKAELDSLVSANRPLASELLQQLDAAWNQPPSYMLYTYKIVTDFMAKFTNTKKDVTDLLFAYNTHPTVIKKVCAQRYASAQEGLEDICKKKQNQEQRMARFKQLRDQKIAQLRDDSCVTTFKTALHACLATGLYGWLWKLVSDEYRALQACLQQALAFLEGFQKSGDLDSLVKLRNELNGYMCAQQNAVQCNWFWGLYLKKIQCVVFPLDREKKLVTDSASTFFKAPLQWGESETVTAAVPSPA